MHTRGGGILPVYDLQHILIIFSYQHLWIQHQLLLFLLYVYSPCLILIKTIIGTLRVLPTDLILPATTETAACTTTVLDLARLAVHAPPRTVKLVFDCGLLLLRLKYQVHIAWNELLLIFTSTKKPPSALLHEALLRTGHMIILGIETQDRVIEAGTEMITLVGHPAHLRPGGEEQRTEIVTGRAIVHRDTTVGVGATAAVAAVDEVANRISVRKAERS